MPDFREGPFYKKILKFKKFGHPPGQPHLLVPLAAT